MIAAPADPDDDPPRARNCLRLVAVMKENFVTALFELLDPSLGKFDSRGLALFLHLLKQRLFHILREMEAAFEFQLRRVGVDRFRLGKIRHGREGLGRLEDLEVQSRLLRLDRSRDTRDSAADDREVEHPVLALRKIRFGQDRVDRFRPGLGGKFQERNPGEIAHDADAGNVGRAEFPRLRQFLDYAGRPAGVQPVGVTFDRIEHMRRPGKHLYRRGERAGSAIIPAPKSSPRGRAFN